MHESLKHKILKSVSNMTMKGCHTKLKFVFFKHILIQITKAEISGHPYKYNYV